MLHTNGLGGVVRYDVTTDLAAQLAGGDALGWLLRKREEGQSGLVENRSREAATRPGPALVVVFELAGGQIDETPPVLSVLQPPVLVQGDPTPSIVVIYSDAGSGVDLSSLLVSFDGAPLAGCAVGFTSVTCTPPPLDEGSHLVTAAVRDLAGNHGSVAHVFDLVLDLQPPVVAIATPADGATLNVATVQVSGTATDDRGVVRLTVNGIEVPLAGASFATEVALAEGSNALFAIATDAAGKQGSAVVVVTRDSVAPKIELDRPADGAIVNQATVAVAGRVTDTIGVASVEVNGTPATLVDGEFEAEVALVEGSNAIDVVAADLAGNAATLSLVVTRLTLPEVGISSPAELAWIVATTVEVTGTVSADAASVTVNGAAASVVGGGFVAPGVPLVEGGNTLTATVLATNGRVATASVHVVRDLTPPRIAVYSPGEGSTTF